MTDDGTYLGHVTPDESPDGLRLFRSHQDNVRRKGKTFRRLCIMEGCEQNRLQTQTAKESPARHGRGIDGNHNVGSLNHDAGLDGNAVG